jgi:hypothetical protein
MTLSDFDALSIDEQSRPGTGVSVSSPAGVCVTVWHNWANVIDRRAWTPAAVLPMPVAATVHHGEITYLDTHVVAARGPQDGIYLATWFESQGELIGMVAIGCLFDGSGVLPPSVEHLRSVLVEWADADRVPFQLARLDFSAALRFNQGDAYVAQNAGFPTSCTPPGRAGTPLIHARPSTNGAPTCDSPPAEKT